MKILLKKKILNFTVVKFRIYHVLYQNTKITYNLCH
jgi:hypothetical protein